MGAKNARVLKKFFITFSVFLSRMKAEDLRAPKKKKGGVSGKYIYIDLFIHFDFFFSLVCSKLRKVCFT